MSDSHSPTEVQRALARDDAKVYFEDGNARLSHAAAFAHGALKSTLIVNGGAVIALLTLVGNSDAVVEKTALFWAFIWFGGGIFASLLASIMSAIGQMFYMQSSFSEGWKSLAVSHGLKSENDGDADDRLGDISIKIVISCAMASIVLFIIGSFVALDAIT